MNAGGPVVAVLAAAALLTGCGTADDQEQARAAVQRFYDAIRQDEGEAACAELSEATREALESATGRSCRGVIARRSHSGGAVVATRVFVKNAKVDLDSGESAFLGRESTGWKLTAVGCRPEDGKARDRPFRCEVEG